jgi:2-polyprenyl-3-methyl-5-hydroxy-6-metoxy-1,4-benzoquinol methylase
MTADTDEQLSRKVVGQGSRVRFVQRFKRDGKLLDVGCASGHFLAAARDAGFNVCGIEVSEWAVKEGKERLGLDIRQGVIESVDYPATFDAATMWHVVEHFEDPVASLVKVRKWLAPGGVLVIECPNSGSFDAGRYGAEWAGWRIPYHLWHLTPKSLAAVLERAGYEVVRVQTTRSLWIRDRVRRIPLLSIARTPISACFTGRDMRIVARIRDTR